MPPYGIMQVTCTCGSTLTLHILSHQKHEADSQDTSSSVTNLPTQPNPNTIPNRTAYYTPNVNSSNTLSPAPPKEKLQQLTTTAKSQQTSASTWQMQDMNKQPQLQSKLTMKIIPILQLEFLNSVSPSTRTCHITGSKIDSNKNNYKSTGHQEQRTWLITTQNIISQSITDVYPQNTSQTRQTHVSTLCLTSMHYYVTKLTSRQPCCHHRREGVLIRPANYPSRTWDSRPMPTVTFSTDKQFTGQSTINFSN